MDWLTISALSFAFFGKNAEPVVGRILEERLRDLYSSYEQGALDFVTHAFADDAVFITLAPTDVFPYLGERRGKEAIRKSFQTLAELFETITYQPVFLVTDEDSGAAIVLARFRQISTGRIIRLFVAHFFQFRHGEIVELREFMDSFDAVEQVLGREIHVTKAC